MRLPLLQTAYLYLRTMIPVLAIWHLVARSVGNPVLLPGPLEVGQAVVALFGSHELLGNALTSLRRILLGYGLALGVGMVLGILMGLSDTIHDLIDPVIELLRPISGIAWIPLALLIFGVGDQLTVFIIFYGSLFAVIVNTLAGVRGCDPQLIQAARTFGASRWVVLTQVVLPAALPTVLVGARVGMGLAWMSLVAAELVGAPTGLGFAVEWYRELLMTPKVVAVIVVIGVLGYLTDRVLRDIRRRLTPWSAGRAAGV